MNTFRQVNAVTFGAYFHAVREATNPDLAHIKAATSPFVESDGARYFLDVDDVAARGMAGFVIRADGDLTNVFSTSRGQGDRLMAAALEAGAETLDCFDGYLPTFYARHGFVIYAREANWTPGGPDVVFMALLARLERDAS